MANNFSNTVNARAGGLVRRPVLATQQPTEDDPWRVGNQRLRRALNSLMSDSRLVDYMYGTHLNSDDANSLELIQNDYPAPGGASVEPKPFEVSHVEDDIYKVQAGTCEGSLIPTQEIDVGTIRPVAILAHPQYLLSIYGGEYVWTASVKSGSDAPALVSSDTILGDVTVIGSSGTEARALIAYIDEDSNLSQVTTGNIVGTFSDDGSLTGKMSGNYNKNA